MPRTYSGPAPSRRSITEPLYQQQEAAAAEVTRQEQQVSALNQNAAPGVTYQRRTDENGNFFASGLAEGYDPATGQTLTAVDRVSLAAPFDPSKPLFNPDGTPAQAPASTRVQGFGQNPGAPTMNTQTGTQTQGGVIEQSRNERLDAAGATPEQRAANQQNLQGIMDPYYGVSPSERARAGMGIAGDPVGSRVRDIQARLEALNQPLPSGRDASGVSTDGSLSNTKDRAATEAARAQERAALLEELEALQRQQQQRDQNAAFSNAEAGNRNTEQTDGSTPTGTEGGQQGTTPSVDPGMQAAIGSLPPEFQLFGQMLLSQMGQYQQAIGTSETAFGSVQQNLSGLQASQEAAIADLKSTYTQTSQAMQGMLDEVRDRNEKHLSDELNAQEQRLEWEQAKQERGLQEEKRKTIDSKIASLALRGGFGSEGGMKEIDEASMKYEEAIRDVQTEFGIQRTELSARFTGLYAEIQNNYAVNSMQNIKDFQGNLEKLSFQSMANDSARVTAENNALMAFTEQQTNLRLGMAKDLTAGVKDITTMIEGKKAQEAEAKRQEQQSAIQYYQWTVGAYGGQNPGVLSAAIQRMQAAGLPTEGLDTPAPTIEEQQLAFGQTMDMAQLGIAQSNLQIAQDRLAIDQAKAAQDAMTAQYTNPLRFTDPVKQNIMFGVQSAVAQNQSAAIRNDDMMKVAQLLDSGKIKEAQQYVYNVAKNNMPMGIQNDFNNRKKWMDLGKMVTDEVKQYEGTLNKFVRFSEKSKQYVALSKDEKWLNLATKLNSYVSEIVFDRGGKALTETELEFIRPYLPMLDQDTGKDVVGKLNALRQNWELENESLMTQFYPQWDGTYYNDISRKEMGQEWFSDTSNGPRSLVRGGTAGGGDDLALSDWLSNVGDGNVLQRYSTRIGYKVWGKNQHQGLDIDGRTGDPIPAFRPGKVVAVVKDPNPGVRKGWGNQVIVEDAYGYRHQYSHLHSFNVKAGDYVSGLQQIGTMGNSGFVIPGPGGDGSHLDYEILKDGKPIDPELYETLIASSHARV